MRHWVGSVLRNRSLFFALCSLPFALAVSIHAANYPLQIIQPQPNLNTVSRYYKAYPGIAYRVPVGVFGGAYPFTYTLTTAPTGMLINSSGIITWPTPTTTGSPHPVTVRVTDQEGTVVTRSWTITVTQQGFLFIDAQNGTHAAGFGCTTGCGDGTINNPFHSMIDVYRGNGREGDNVAYQSMSDTTYNDYFIYWRQGIYGLEGYFENAETPQQYQMEWRGNAKPHVWLAYPGETVVIDHNLAPGSIAPGFPPDSNGAFLDWRDGDSTDAYIQGITFRDARNHVFRFNGDRKVFFECTFTNLGPSLDGHNSSLIMFSGSGSPGTDQYNFIKDNLFDRVSSQGAGAYIKTYSLGYSVFEGNRFTNPSGSGVEGLALKANDRHIDVRQNTFIGDFNSGSISGNWADGGNFEIRFNKVMGALSDATVSWFGALVMNYHNSMAAPVQVYRNTFEGTVMLRRATSSQFPIRMYNNVIVNRNSGTPAGSHVSHSSEVTAPSIMILGTGPTANLVGYPTDTIINANGDLTSAYASYLGTHGYQLGSGTPPPPPPPPPGSRCDVNGNGSTDVNDVQQCVNQVIGPTVCSTGDINQDGSCTVVDVQRVVNATLGGQCVITP
jgi:hypothetical protein